MSETNLRRIGWALGALFGLFMLGASALPKLAGMGVAQATMDALNWPNAPLMMIGALEAVSTVLFLIPATGLLGAVLMMAIWAARWPRTCMAARRCSAIRCSASIWGCSCLRG